MDRARRAELTKSFEKLQAAIVEAIKDADPVTLLVIGAPEDEYSPEVGTILPRLREARSVDDVARILHEEFGRWFGTDQAGPRELYSRAAQTIWNALEEHRAV